MDLTSRIPSNSIVTHSPTPLPSLPSTHALPVEPPNRFCAP